MSWNSTKDWFFRNINTTNSQTNLKVSGVYLLYINHKNLNNRIIPFYVGKSNDIYQRFIQHKNALNKLINLYNADYDHRSFYLHYHQAKQSGKHLYSKLFYYLKENQLSINDLKVICLWHGEQALLVEKERYFIEQSKAYVYGFNQLPFISQSYAVLKFEEMYQKTNQVDLNQLLIDGISVLNHFETSWLDFGYGVFNIHEFIKFGLLQKQAFKQRQRIRNQHFDLSLYNEFINKFDAFCDFWKQIKLKYSFEF